MIGTPVESEWFVIENRSRSVAVVQVPLNKTDCKGSIPTLQQKSGQRSRLDCDQGLGDHFFIGFTGRLDPSLSSSRNRVRIGRITWRRMAPNPSGSVETILGNFKEAGMHNMVMGNSFRSNRLHWALALVLAGVGASPGSGVQAANVSTLPTDPVVGYDVAKLRGAFPDAAMTFSSATGVAKFVRFPGVTVATGKNGAVDAESSADAFVDRFGGVFGVKARWLQLTRSSASRNALLGTSRVTYQQLHDGVPVYGAQLQVHLDRGNNVTTANGTIVPGIQVDMNSALNADQAVQLGKNAVTGSHGVAPFALRTHVEGLFIYRTGLAQGVPGSDHLVYKVIVSNDSSIRDFVFVDAVTGKVVEQVNAAPHGLDRELYESSPSSTDASGFELNAVWAEGDSTAGLAADPMLMVLATEDIYNVFSNISGGTYGSFDGAGATMSMSYGSYPSGSCPNAWWNGSTISVCNGLFADDVIGHEWTHAYTEKTHELVYQWQPGALNEAYSDMFGELSDINNGTGLDDPSYTTRRTDENCSAYGDNAIGSATTDASFRWLMGEDVTAAGMGGALRDMWMPSCFGNPGKVSDAYYACSTSDAGGVHANSGVPNHAFALLHDGGNYNGYSISALGRDRVAAIYWRAMTVYQDPYTDFESHADALEAACADLIGAPLYKALTSGSLTNATSTISATQCNEVKEAMAAVEMRAAPACGFEPVLSGGSPEYCKLGTKQNITAKQTFEINPGWWVDNSGMKLTQWTERNWRRVTSLPGGRSGSAMWADGSSTYGNCTTDDESGVVRLYTPTYTLSSLATRPHLAFTHYVATERRYDGGDLQISINGGSYQNIPSEALTFNSYNGVIRTDATHQMAGVDAFTGTDEGTIEGSWGTTIVDLGGLASTGDKVRIRFRLGVDGCGGVDGWYIDDVEMYTCR